MGLPSIPRSTARPRSQAWQNFLKAAVARYGPGGTYWAPGGNYDQDYGTSAAPLPIKSWQIWNEPNLKKFFGPGSTSQQTAKKYARLLAISHDAIKSQGSAGHDRPRRHAEHPRGRELEGLGLPQQPLRGARGQERLRRRRPASLRVRRWIRFARGSDNSAR